VIDTLLVDDEATGRVDRFDRVRRYPAVALGTLVRARISSDVLVEVSFLDVWLPSLSPFQRTRHYGEPLTN